MQSQLADVNLYVNFVIESIIIKKLCLKKSYDGVPAIYGLALKMHEVIQIGHIDLLLAVNSELSRR
jgi:hypothetical protein